MDDGAGMMRGNNDAVKTIEDGAYCSNIFLKGCEDGRSVAQYANSLRCAGGHGGGHGCRKHEGGSVDTLGDVQITNDSNYKVTDLMLDNNLGTSTETTRGAKAVSDGTDEHVNLRGGDIVKLSQTTAGPSNGAKGEALVEDQTELVLLLQFNLKTS